MLIKFKKPDPRAGMVVNLDNAVLAQKFIDDGHATAEKAGGNEDAPTANGVAPMTVDGGRKTAAAPAPAAAKKRGR